jgi:hypothetical protein
LEIYDASRRLLTGIGRLVNFSAVGACFSSTAALAKGVRLHARLRLLREGRLDIIARVIWIRRRTNSILYGIEFENVRPAREK